MNQRTDRHTAIVLLNFGEPEVATEATVIPFLERIFLTNAALSGKLPEEELRARSRAMAERRAPGLLEEYRAIGGSPLNRQAEAQARALEAELERRGHAVRCYLGMQFTEPFIEDAVRRAAQDGAVRLIGLPTYPLCGPSTTLAALDSLRAAAGALSPGLVVREIAGWHRHPLYLRIRADAIRAVWGAAAAPGAKTALVFSAHGTPLRYLEAGSRYQEYVEDSCRLVAREAGIDGYLIGYQNHTNRPLEWTQPDIEDVIGGVEADAVVVDAISFMHEQSETLAELDLQLREGAEARGLAFHRVPVPHDDPRFAAVLADLAEPFLHAGPHAALALDACACRGGDARCLARRPESERVPA